MRRKVVYPAATAFIPFPFSILCFFKKEETKIGSQNVLAPGVVFRPFRPLQGSSKWIEMVGVAFTKYFYRHHNKKKTMVEQLKERPYWFC